MELSTGLTLGGSDLKKSKVAFPIPGGALRGDYDARGEEKVVRFGHVEIGRGFGDAVGAGEEEARGVDAYCCSSLGLGKHEGCLKWGGG